MTWIFVYTAVLLLGLLLTAASGPSLRTPHAGAARPVTLPRADAHHAVRPRLARSVGGGLAVLGLVGIALSTVAAASRVGVALIAAGAGAVTALLLAVAARRPRGQSAGARQATVLRDMAAGGYGQVEVEGAGRRVVMAAYNAGDAPLRAGSVVDVISDERSVLTVRGTRAL